MDVDLVVTAITVVTVCLTRITLITQYSDARLIILIGTLQKTFLFNLKYYEKYYLIKKLSYTFKIQESILKHSYRTCQHFGTCYKCIAHKHGDTCLPEITEYKFKMRLNKKKGIRKIICDMNPEVLVNNDNAEVTDSYF